MPALPLPHEPGRYTLAVVCLGNICRSPMAHVVLERHLDDAGLDGSVTVLSAGTAGWHTDKPMDRRAAATLTAAGYDASRHRARQVVPGWLGDLDLVLAMDGSNLADLAEVAADLTADGVAPDPDRLRLFRSFDPLATGDDCDVPDPYYGDDDGFEAVLRMVERTSRALVAAVADRLQADLR